MSADMSTAITAIIPCFNEEDCIAQAIDSVLWADEIIVVDSFSTDRTLEICRSYGERIRLIQHAYENSARQKNWIIPQAAHEWIFLLDADEVASDELITEIKALELDASRYSAYAITRDNYFFERKLRYIWKSDRVVRLFHRDQSRYQDLAVHAKLETEGNVARLSSVIRHHSFKSMEHYRAKLERYAHWSAKDYTERTGSITAYHKIIKPAARFIKHYVVQGGFLDGKAGYQISRLQSWAVRRRYEILAELRRNSR